MKLTNQKTDPTTKTSSKAWMIRAGEGGRLIDAFAKEYIAIGWQELGDMSRLTNQEAFRRHFSKVFPDKPIGAIRLLGNMVHKFCRILTKGDKVITYDPKNREYLIGTVTSEYMYKPDVVKDSPHIRKAKWQARVRRDNLSTDSQNSLRSNLTLFSISDDVLTDILSEAAR